MRNVIEFERFKDVTDWSMTRIREYCREKGWPALHIHLPQKENDPVLIERLPRSKYYAE